MTSLTHLLAWKMLIHVMDLLEGIPYTRETSEEWVAECVGVWNACSSDLSRQDATLGLKILTEFVRYIQTLPPAPASPTPLPSGPLDARQSAIHRLLALPQVAQRTEGWYAESLTILSASQYETIFKTPRTRGQLVMEKAGLSTKPRSFRTVVRTEELSAFTWGIRFEPVVKQFYEHLTETTVADLGRLRHPTNPKLGASPDGLVVEDRSATKESLGRFVEFKAPVSRVIDSEKIPEGYWMQMQIQMEVGDIEECDYLEVTFGSEYKTPYTPPQETPQYHGIITLVRKPVPKTYTSWETGETLTEEGDELRYVYSPLNAEDTWEPVLEEKETILERIPWHIATYAKTTVKRDREWYETKGKPAEALFWADVDAAKAGTWTLPESSRKSTKKMYDFVED